MGNVRLVIAGFAPFQNHHISGVQQERVALLWQGGAQRHISVAVSRHPFGKLRHVIQVIDPVADLGAAGVVTMAAIRTGHTDTVPIGNAEPFLAACIKKANAAGRLFHVLIQHLPAIAVDIQVIIALHGIQPQQIGIFRRIHPESVLRNKILGKHTFFVFIAVSGKAAAVFENAVIALVKTQGIDKIIKLILERLCFQLPAMILP